MKISDINLQEMLKFSPEKGQIFIGSDRMLLFRYDALKVLRKLLYEQVGERLARAVLSQFGFRCGQGDYETLNAIYTWDSVQDRFGAGPVMHTWEGIVHVTPKLLEMDPAAGHFHMIGEWRNSYEAQIHLEHFGRSSAPVCHSLTGYASGWSTAFFGSPLLAIETQCVGAGDELCVFEIKPRDAWDARADPWRATLEANDFSLSKELEEKIALVERQAIALSELSTPIMEVWDDVLVLPIVGVVDTRRSAEIMDALLLRLVQTKARCAIIDITGVEVVDTKTADYLLKIVRAAQLLGTRCVLTGLSPAVAQTLVEIGADLREVQALRDLKEGLKDCLRFLGSLRTRGALT